MIDRMAIYHLEAQIIGRSDGRSAIACAAYRAGEAITDERTGTVHRHGDPARVVHAEVLAPEGAPAWARDRAALWNRVEVGERRKDAQLAREFELALPVELTLAQQRDLVRGWVAAELTPHGVIADIGIHDERKPGKPANPHSHVMVTMRGLAADGEGFGPKLRQLNWNGTISRWRESWAEHVNGALERAGLDERVDHRSHADRGLEIEPTTKEGPAARGIEARGKVSARMARNRAIRAQNAVLSYLKTTAGRAVGIARSLAKARVQRPEPTPSPAQRRGVYAIAEEVTAAKARDGGGQAERAKPARGPQLTSAPAPDIDDAVLLAAMRDQQERNR
jgi:hypothetical protein